ncbi:lysophospholipase L1-like esterase [Paenibacillus sp. V4I9]|nr:lysophospholipase L1-like esterase [Paenibacillus sp. V4I9]
MNAGRILFQGDSITDGARGRNDDLNHILGHGYPYLIASKLGNELAEKQPLFINRGISGNRVSDLYARWNEDAFSLRPDEISILIGVNDAGRIVNGDPGGATDRFERSYRHLLGETKEVLPAARLILCEPFIPAEPWKNGKLGRNGSPIIRTPSGHSPTNFKQSLFRYKLYYTMPARELMHRTGSGMECTRRRRDTI